jgi:hypothetical protein
LRPLLQRSWRFLETILGEDVAMAGDRLLGIYLNDHLAGSSALRDRCRAARDANSGSDLGAFLNDLLGEIIEDRRALLEVMAAVGVAPSAVKTTLARLAERLGRLKPNGQLTGYSPLSRFEELEALSLGVEGKRLLWIMLSELGDPRLARFDFAALTDRAERQRDGIEHHRRAAARTAFSVGEGHTVRV